MRSLAPTRSLLLVWFFSGVSLAVAAHSPHAKLRGVNLTDVTWTEGFWAERFALCRQATIPSVEAALLDERNSEQLINLKIAAGLEQGNYRGTHWSDGDCYKWIEAMAYMFALTKDAELERKMDYWIGVIARAQRPDGYLSTNMQLQKRTPYEPPTKSAYPGSYHEMYNMGHLLTAACAHHQMTGKDNFLRIARKLGDHLHQVFQPGSKELLLMSGNLPNIMGLVDLYRVTGDRRYLATAQAFVDARGARTGGTDLTQDRVPFREETQAVGHAVFATYLYCGAADLYMEHGEQALRAALERIWQSAALRRTYITGGACAIHKGKSARGDEVHEAFGADYQLPNRTAYNETCANIGYAMWNWRMLQISGEAKYADIVERVLYNSGLSPLSADGRHFCYANPLSWDGRDGWPTKHYTGQRWFVHSCYCCPPQIARTLAGLGRWCYSVSPDALWVHLYGGHRLQTKLPDGSPFSLTQQTDYPWDGRIKITVTGAPAKPVALHLRIPGWAERVALKVNGQTLAARPGSYAVVRRVWSAGDVVEVILPMETRLMEAHPAVDACRDRVAVMRGPLVYCHERPPGEPEIFLPENISFTPRRESNLVVLTGHALTVEGRDEFIRQNVAAPSHHRSGGWTDTLYRKLPPRSLKRPTTGVMEITLIPYFAWGNRGPVFMDVWLPRAK